jgi:hypothetical protein
MNMMSRLMHAAHDGDVQRLKQCLLDGDDIDAIASCVTADGNKLLFVTALYLAAQQGHYDICKFLVDHGANSTIQCYSPHDSQVFTCASVALVQGHLQVWLYLKSLQTQSMSKIKHNTLKRKGLYVSLLHDQY